jgi:hypothetical protein
LCPDPTSSWTLWEGFPKEFSVLDDLFKVRSHCVTEARELNAGNAANEKLTAEFLFESLNGCAQRWLCDIAPSRRPRKVQLVAHRKEVANFPHIHSILRMEPTKCGAIEKRGESSRPDEFHPRARSLNRAGPSRATRLPMFGRCHDIAANVQTTLGGRGRAAQTSLVAVGLMAQPVELWARPPDDIGVDPPEGRS